MYFQITTRCNMSCAHCCFDCTEEGEDMSVGDFKNILYEHRPEFMVIGGGEPTLHPDFFEILFYAMSIGDVWMATNGSNTEISLALAEMNRVKDGIFKCVLSQDEYHDPIDRVVISAFESMGKRNFNNSDYYLNGKYRYTERNVGRAREFFGIQEEIDCPSEGPFVRTDGKVYHCGCHDSPEIDFDREYGNGECWRKIKLLKTA